MPKASLTIGYGSGGSQPFAYTLRDGQDVDVGFLKLFLATEPVDLSYVSQDSPFGRLDHRHIRRKFKMAPKAISIRDSLCITVVQRRRPPEDFSLRNLQVLIVLYSWSLRVWIRVPCPAQLMCLLAYHVSLLLILCWHVHYLL